MPLLPLSWRPPGMLDVLKKLYEATPKRAHVQKAWEAFQAKGLPSHKWDPFRHVPLAKLYRHVASSGESEIHATHTSQVNFTFLQNRILKLLATEKNPFVLLNLALSTKDHYLYLDQEAKVTFRNRGFSMPRLHLFVPKNSQAKLFLHHEGEGFTNSLLDVTLEENSQIQIFDTSSHEGTLHYSCRINQKKGSTASHITYEHTAMSSRRDFHVRLLGEASQVHLAGLTDLTHRDAHTHVFVEHVAPHTESHQHYRALVREKGINSFYGTIYVHKEAQKTNAYQLSKALLLHDKAKSFAEPNLEIYADDVKASHGATTGAVNGEELFFLRSRGLSESEAEHLLIQAFAREILCLMPSE